MRRISTFITDNTELGSLTDKAQKLSDLQHLWRSAIDEPLRSLTQAGDIQHKRLTVYASNGTVAAKVKLILPSLLTQLQKRGLEVTAIRVQVQVQSSPQKPPKTPRKLSKLAATELQQLAGELQGSPLAEVLNKLAGRR